MEKKNKTFWHNEQVQSKTMSLSNVADNATTESSHHICHESKPNQEENWFNKAMLMHHDIAMNDFPSDAIPPMPPSPVSATNLSSSSNNRNNTTLLDPKLGSASKSSFPVDEPIKKIHGTNISPISIDRVMIDSARRPVPVISSDGLIPAASPHIALCPILDRHIMKSTSSRGTASHHSQESISSMPKVIPLSEGHSSSPARQQHHHSTANSLTPLSNKHLLTASDAASYDQSIEMSDDIHRSKSPLTLGVDDVLQSTVLPSRPIAAVISSSSSSLVESRTASDSIRLSPVSPPSSIAQSTPSNSKVSATPILIPMQYQPPQHQHTSRSEPPIIHPVPIVWSSSTATPQQISAYQLASGRPHPPITTYSPAKFSNKIDDVLSSPPSATAATDSTGITATQTTPVSNKIVTSAYTNALLHNDTSVQVAVGHEAFEHAALPSTAEAVTISPTQHNNHSQPTTTQHIQARPQLLSSLSLNTSQSILTSSSTHTLEYDSQLLSHSPYKLIVPSSATPVTPAELLSPPYSTTAVHTHYSHSVAHINIHNSDSKPNNINNNNNNNNNSNNIHQHIISQLSVRPQPPPPLTSLPIHTTTVPTSLASSSASSSSSSSMNISPRLAPLLPSSSLSSIHNGQSSSSSSSSLSKIIPNHAQHPPPLLSSRHTPTQLLAHALSSSSSSLHSTAENRDITHSLRHNMVTAVAQGYIQPPPPQHAPAPLISSRSTIVPAIETSLSPSSSYSTVTGTITVAEGILSTTTAINHTTVTPSARPMLTAASITTATPRPPPPRIVSPISTHLLPPSSSTTTAVIARGTSAYNLSPLRSTRHLLASASCGKLNNTTSKSSSENESQSGGGGNNNNAIETSMNITAAVVHKTAPSSVATENTSGTTNVASDTKSSESVNS